MLNSMLADKPMCETCKVFNISCFASLKLEDIANLKYDKISSFYKKDQVIFHEDNRAIGVYCLNKGKVKLFKSGYDGKEQIVRFVTPGNLFGYRSITGSKMYSINAQACEDSIACFIENEVFFNLTQQYPLLYKNLLISLSSILEDTESNLTSIAQMPVRERLAEALLKLHAKFSHSENKLNNYINLSREDLANIIGSATETVIRLLSEFKVEKLISIEGRKIKIINPSQLQKIAHS